MYRWQKCSYALGRRRSRESSTPCQSGEATSNLRCFAVVRNVLTDVGKVRIHSFPHSLCSPSVGIDSWSHPMFGCKDPPHRRSWDDRFKRVPQHRVRTATPAGNDRNAEIGISPSSRYEVSLDT